MYFWNSLVFSMMQQMLAIWSLVPLTFLNPACTSGSSRFTYCWSVAWKILSIALLACEMSATEMSEHSLALAFGLEWKNLLQSCGHWWIFHICWHIECSTFTASFFRIWNSSAGISSPPLAFFLVMLPKAHLTSHYWMSGCRWVITPSWLSGSLRPFFVQFVCVFLPPLLNIFHENSFIRELIRFMRAPPFWPKHLPKVPPLNTILLASRISSYELSGHRGCLRVCTLISIYLWFFQFSLFISNFILLQSLKLLCMMINHLGRMFHVHLRMYILQFSSGVSFLC